MPNWAKKLSQPDRMGMARSHAVPAAMLRHAASIRYQMSEGAAINEGLVRSLHIGSFLAGKRNLVAVAQCGQKPAMPKLASRLRVVFPASSPISANGFSASLALTTSGPMLVR